MRGETKMMDDDILIKGSYVKISNYRVKVMNTLEPGEVKIPKEIAKDTDIIPNHISKTLRELKDNNLIECINEEARKGRLYRLTPLGIEVKQYLEG